MKRARMLIVIALLSSALALTAGCAPKWVITATQYAVSDALYNAQNIEQEFSQAAEGDKFVIMRLNIQHNGPSPADIRDDLIFKLRELPSPMGYVNFYETNQQMDLYDDIQRVYAKGESDIGSIFFYVPSSLDLSGCILEVRTSSYSLIGSWELFNLPEVVDYPADW